MKSNIDALQLQLTSPDPVEGSHPSPPVSWLTSGRISSKEPSPIGMCVHVLSTEASPVTVSASLPATLTR